MAVNNVPPIATFFGLPPSFLAGPAASSSLINNLLFGSSFQQVPINFGPPNPGIPPLFGGQGLTGLGTGQFNLFGTPQILQSPFGGGGVFSGPSQQFPSGVFDPFGGNAAFLQPAFGFFNPQGNIPGITGSFNGFGFNNGGFNANPFAQQSFGFSPFGAQSFGFNGMF